MTDTYKCHKCRVTKPVTAFNKRKSTPMGHNYVCKACVNAAQRSATPNEHPVRPRNYAVKRETVAPGVVRVTFGDNYEVRNPGQAPRGRGTPGLQSGMSMFDKY